MVNTQIVNVPKPSRIVPIGNDSGQVRQFRKSQAVILSSEFSLEHKTKEAKGSVTYRLYAEQVNVFDEKGTLDDSRTHYKVEARYGGQVKPKVAFCIQLFKNGRFQYTEPNPPKELNHIESIADDWLSFTQAFDPTTKEKIYSFFTLAQAVNDGMTPIFSLLTFILFTQFQRSEDVVGEARAKNKLKSLPLDEASFYGSIIIAYQAGVDFDLIKSCFSHDQKAISALTSYIEDPTSQIKLLEGTVLDPNLKGSIAINFSNKEEIEKALTQLSSNSKDMEKYDEAVTEIWEKVFTDGTPCPTDEAIETLTELIFTKANPMTVNLTPSEVTELVTPEGLKVTPEEQAIIDSVSNQTVEASVITDEAQKTPEETPEETPKTPEESEVG